VIPAGLRLRGAAREHEGERDAQAAHVLANVP